MKVIITNNPKSNNKGRIYPTFKGPLDSALTQALITIDTNPMASAALVDTTAMVIPRTYVDTKKRNKYAGAETFFREATGTVIVCLSGGFLAKGIAWAYNKLFDKETNVNPNLWTSNESFELFKHSWEKSKNTSQYVKNVFENVSGLDGKQIKTWKNIDWAKVDWVDSDKWAKIKWKDTKWRNIQNRLKDGNSIIETISAISNEKSIDKSDLRNILNIVESRITNAIGVNSSINVKIGQKEFNSSLKNIIRDTHDAAKHVFSNTAIDLEKASAKIKTMNKVKTLGAIGIAASAGLLDQYVNRLITKRRRGKDDFVGTIEEDSIKINETKENMTHSKARLNVLKVLTSAGMFALSMKVMKIKNPKDFVKKLEFTSVATSGNVIKTIYTALLIGRFLASRDEDELRETATRDYLGFLNWLVVGGFVSKGFGQLFFDKKLENLFNVSGSSKGVKNWLNNVSLKSHAEIGAKGGEFAKSNIWKLNVMHTAGLLYSGLALGFALPLLNIFLTKHKKHSVGEPKGESTAKGFNFTSNQPLPEIYKKVAE